MCIGEDFANLSYQGEHLAGYSGEEVIILSINPVIVLVNPTGCATRLSRGG